MKKTDQSSNKVCQKCGFKMNSYESAMMDKCPKCGCSCNESCSC